VSIVPYKIYFYLSQDELSNKLLKILDELIKDVRNKSKISSRDIWPASAVTNVKIFLSSVLGGREELECEIWTTLREHEEGMKRRFGLTSLPAVRIGEKIFTGLSTLEIASDLHSLLTSTANITGEQILYHLAATAQRIVEKDLKKEVEVKEISESNILKASINERVAKLDKLLKEGKIDEETYKKMKRLYEELLGKSP